MQPGVVNLIVTDAAYHLHALCTSRSGSQGEGAGGCNSGYHVGCGVWGWEFRVSVPTPSCALGFSNSQR
jgi:hypothetical protein